MGVVYVSGIFTQYLRYMLFSFCATPLYCFETIYRYAYPLYAYMKNVIKQQNRIDLLKYGQCPAFHDLSQSFKYKHSHNSCNEKLRNPHMFPVRHLYGKLPSGKYTSLNVRRIIKDSIKKDISDQLDLWMCTTCYNCQERCPRGIKVTDAILSLRAQAVKKGSILPAHRAVCKFLIEMGHAVPIDDIHITIREKIGLSEPETVRKYPQALKDVKTCLLYTS